MALGEPVGPIKASILSSEIIFLNSVTVWFGSLASSMETYSTVRSPTLVGKRGTVLRCGKPTTAVGPVAEAITPILTCDWAGVAKAARTTDKAKAVRVNFIICRAD